MKFALIFPIFTALVLMCSQTGNARTYTTALFSTEEKDFIMKHFKEIVESDVPCTIRPFEKVSAAARGMYLRPRETTHDQEQLCRSLYEAHAENQLPIVADDSITAWGNVAAEKYGLEIKDIVQMKRGQKLKVILMDRNVGDYLDGTRAGTKIMPTKEGFTYATYTHKNGLKGKMEFEEIAFVEENFEWEINLASLGKKLFWGPIPQNISSDLKDLDPRIKVGWRGPAIRFTDAKKMPKYVTHYDNWWNDYLPFRKEDFLH